MIKIHPFLPLQPGIFTSYPDHDATDLSPRMLVAQKAHNTLLTTAWNSLIRKRGAALTCLFYEIRIDLLI